MKLRNALFFLAVVSAVAGLDHAAMAQGTDKNSIQTADGPAACEDFQKNDDGSWTPLIDIKVIGQSEAVGLAAKSAPLKSGVSKPAGVDVGAMLDEQCH